MVCNIEGIILEANKLLIGMLGDENTQLIDTSFLRFISPEDQDTYHKHVKELFENNNHQKCEIVLSLPENNLVNVIIESTSTTANGETFIRSILINVSEQKQAQHTLRESETKFRNITEGSLQGVFVHRAFKPLFANQRCAKIFGYNNPEEILSMNSILKIFLDT